MGMNFKDYYMREGITKIPQPTLENMVNWVKEYCYFYVNIRWKNSFNYEPDMPDDVFNYIEGKFNEDDFPEPSSIQQKIFDIKEFPYSEKIKNPLDSIKFKIGKYIEGGIAAFDMKKAEEGEALIELDFEGVKYFVRPIREKIESQDVPDIDDIIRTIEINVQRATDEYRGVLRHELAHMVEWMIGKLERDSYDFSAPHVFRSEEFEPILNNILSVLKRVIGRSGQPISSNEFRWGMKGNWVKVAKENEHISDYTGLSITDDRLKNFYKNKTKRWKGAVRKLYIELSREGLVE